MPTYGLTTSWNDSGLILRPPHRARFEGKMLLLQHAAEGTICNPAAAAYYDSLVRRNLGSKVDEQYRLYFVANAHHIPASMVAPYQKVGAANRLIEYQGVVDEALHHLVNWVEKGVPAPPSTRYSMSRDYALVMPMKADERRGLQPVVRLTANGADKATVRPGEAVNFSLSADLPSGTGRITAVEWDLDGSGRFTPSAAASLGGAAVSQQVSHPFTTPGTYFVAARVSSTSKTGGKARRHVTNLGRARVVVA